MAIGIELRTRVDPSRKQLEVVVSWVYVFVYCVDFIEALQVILWSGNVKFKRAW